MAASARFRPSAARAAAASRATCWTTQAAVPSASCSLQAKRPSCRRPASSWRSHPPRRCGRSPTAAPAPATCGWRSASPAPSQSSRPEQMRRRPPVPIGSTAIVRVERLLGRLKEWRALATRHEKTAGSYVGVAVGLGGVLHPAVAVVDQAGRRPAALQGHDQRGHAQPGPEVVGHGPAGELAHGPAANRRRVRFSANLPSSDARVPQRTLHSSAGGPPPAALGQVPAVCVVGRRERPILVMSADHPPVCRTC